MNAGSSRLWSLISRSVAFSASFKQIHRPLSVSKAMARTADDVDDILRNNPYYKKYASKINTLQQSAPENFKARVEEYKSTKAKPKDGSSSGREYSSLSQPKKILERNEQVYNDKMLNDIMRTELIETMTVDEISKIWESHFKTKDAISATIPSDLYNMMYLRGREYPIFVLPVPRGEGYEFFLSQVQRHEIHFTSILNYQAHKENAPECLTIVHYTELQERGIVLMHGEFNKDVLNGQEAQCLANQFQLYYGKNDEKKLNLLQRLNYSPREFKHMDLIAELESLSL